MKRLLLILLSVLLIAACGAGTPSSSSTTSSSPQPPAPAKGHPCVGTGFYMQCLGHPTPRLISPPDRGAPPSLKLGASYGANGLDFAWGGPVGQNTRAWGAKFGASYLSGSSKDWTYSLAHSYVTSGLGVVFVWETSADRSLAGFNAGYSDAFNATHEANALGFRTGHIDYATDLDTTGRYDFVPYYQGAAAWDRRVGFTTGGYGGLNTVRTLCERGVTTKNWQTLAWSYGYWMPPSCAPLRQTSINDYWHGYSVDYDVAVAADYGQSNLAPAPPPRPVCFGPHAQGTAFCRQVHAKIRSQASARDASRRVYDRLGCSVLAQRDSWFSGQLRTHPRVKTAARRRALHDTRVAYAARSCGVFQQRYNFFAAAILAETKKYG